MICWKVINLGGNGWERAETKKSDRKCGLRYNFKHHCQGRNKRKLLSSKILKEVKEQERTFQMAANGKVMK